MTRTGKPKIKALATAARELAKSPGFDEVVALIQAARARALAAVNTELVGLYWQVGEYISQKLASAEWGDAVVDQLAAHLALTQPGLQGFSRQSDVKKPHERASIGMLLCASKDAEVVEYALSRALSPTLIAQYQTMLPAKALLRAKLHEIYQALAMPSAEAGSMPTKSPRRKKR